MSVLAWVLGVLRHSWPGFVARGGATEAHLFDGVCRFVFMPFLAGVCCYLVCGGWSLAGLCGESCRVRWSISDPGGGPCGCLSLPFLGGCCRPEVGGPRAVPGGLLWVLFSAFFGFGMASADVVAVVHPTL